MLFNTFYYILGEYCLPARSPLGPVEGVYDTLLKYHTGLVEFKTVVLNVYGASDCVCRPNQNTTISVIRGFSIARDTMARSSNDAFSSQDAPSEELNTAHRTHKPPTTSPQHLKHTQRISNTLPSMSESTTANNSDTPITHLTWILHNSDHLSKLVLKLHVRIPAEFERRLSRITCSFLSQGSKPPKAAAYWFRIAYTASELFLLEAFLGGCAQEKFHDRVELAWECYYTAVRYAMEVDADGSKKHLVGTLGQALVQCGQAVDRLLEDMVFLETQ